MSNLALVIAEVSQGKIKREAEDFLQKLVQAIDKHGGSGHITIKLTVKKLNEGSVQVTGDVNAKMPKPILLPSIFFATEDFALVRTDPRQAELPIRMMEGGKPEPQTQQQAGA
jgi:hypothetical protein